MVLLGLLRLTRRAAAMGGLCLIAAALPVVAAPELLLLTTGPGLTSTGAAGIRFGGSGSNSLLRRDLETAGNTILNSALPSGIWNLATAIDRSTERFYYVTDERIQITDFAIGALVASSPLSHEVLYCLQFDGASGHLFALSPKRSGGTAFDGGTVVFMHATTLLLQVDPLSGGAAVKGELPGGLRNLNCALDVVGRRFFYQTADTLVVADLDTGELVDRFPMPLELYGLDFDTASRLLYAMVLGSECIGSQCGESGGSFIAAYRDDPNSLVAISPVDGSVLSIVSAIPSGGMNFLSSIDPLLGQFHYRTRHELVSVSLATGLVLDQKRSRKYGSA